MRRVRRPTKQPGGVKRHGWVRCKEERLESVPASLKVPSDAYTTQGNPCGPTDQLMSCLQHRAPCGAFSRHAARRHEAARTRRTATPITKALVDLFRGARSPARSAPVRWDHVVLDLMQWPVASLPPSTCSPSPRAECPGAAHDPARVPCEAAPRRKGAARSAIAEGSKCVLLVQIWRDMSAQSGTNMSFA